MAFVIEGKVYLDKDNYRSLPTPVGPFVSDKAAREFMNDMLPLWGSWEVVQLANPLTLEWAKHLENRINKKD